MKKFIILIPLYNDWKSVKTLIQKIENEIQSWKTEVSIIIVNDASIETKSDFSFNLKKISKVKILNMKENTGHQRCIAAGLKYICNNEEFDHVIIMDADGEDRPEELTLFYKKTLENNTNTITGNRFKRSEGIFFKFAYEIHKLLTLIFTGKLIKFGNFTCLPRAHAELLIMKSYLWNSYSGSVTKFIKDRAFISSIRGVRYVQPSKMNFAGLVFHSLSIISVFMTEAFIRSLLLFLVYFYLIFNNVSFFTLIPIIFLFLFIFVIFRISKRSNIIGFNKSLDNINNIDTL